MGDPVFDIREFIPSTSHFFHEDWQIEMVARMCPNIEKMLFIQPPNCCPTLGKILDDIYMDATSQINAKKICHWSKVCHVTSLTLDFIGSTQIKTVHD